MKLLPVLLVTAGLATAQHGIGHGGGHMSGGAPMRAKGSGPAHPTPAPKASAATRIERNPALAQRLAPLLPQGMTAEQAAAGFKNLGQFVAALHVSKNLGIPFADLQSRMTGDKAVSLGKAVTELRPDLTKDQTRTAVRTAETEAKQSQHPESRG